MTTWQYRPNAFTSRDIEEAIRLFKSRPCGAGINGHVVIRTAKDPTTLPQLDGIEWRKNRHLRKDTIAIETGD